MKKIVNQFLQDESGATAIEYGLIAAGIAVAIVTAVTQFSETRTKMFVDISNSIKEAINS